MINKIKDFLKNKLARRRSSDSSDQDVFSDQKESEQKSSDQTNDQEIDIDEIQKVTWKDKLAQSFNGVRQRVLKVRLPAWKLPAVAKTKVGGGTSLLSPSLSQGIEKFLNQKSREP